MGGKNKIQHFLVFRQRFLARLWTNASGGCNLQQSLTVTHTVPTWDKIWTVLSGGDIVSLRKEIMKKKYSVNTVDEYGRSFLGLVYELPSHFLEGNQVNIMQHF
jgi:hypothetical protein